MRKLWLSLVLVAGFAASAQAQYTQPDFSSAAVVMYDGDASKEYSGQVVCCQLGVTTGTATNWNWWYGIYDADAETIYLSGSDLGEFSCDSFVMRFSFFVSEGTTNLWSHYDASDASADPDVVVKFSRGGTTQLQQPMCGCGSLAQVTSGTGTPVGWGAYAAPSRPPSTPEVDPPTEPMPNLPSGPVGPA